MKKIAVFASGNGSNAENIIRHFEKSALARVDVIYCNNPEAYVRKRAKNLGVPCVMFNREVFYNSDVILDDLKQRCIDLIVLAGFLWLVPVEITHAFVNRIVNIHPALLPKFGGKGMYGDRVHQAVIEAGETQSGITIHFVNDKYDSGSIISQHTCPVLVGDTGEILAQRIHQLEYKHFPKEIEKLIAGITA